MQKRDDDLVPEADGTAVAATVAAMPDSGIVGPPPPPGQAADDPLEGRVWGLIEIEDADGPRAVLAGSEVNLLLTSGSLSGSAGCNTMAGSYEREGSDISFGPIASTRLLCAMPEGVMDQERAVMNALENTTSVVLEDGLELRDAAGRTRLRFIAAAERPLDLSPQQPASESPVPPPLP